MQFKLQWWVTCRYADCSGAGAVGRGHVGALGCGAFRSSGTLHVFLALGTLRACGAFHAFPQGPFVTPPHLPSLPRHRHSPLPRRSRHGANGRADPHAPRRPLASGTSSVNMRWHTAAPSGVRPMDVASRGVADHGDGKGSVLHYVRAEPHCTLLCASWDSAVSMRQTQGLECRI